MNTSSARAPVVILCNFYRSWTPAERGEEERVAREMADGLRELGHRVENVEFWKDVRPALRRFRPSEWIVFNWCEGVEDEVHGEARVCADLDALGYTYTGNSPRTLALALEKGRVKEALRRAQLSTPPGRQFRAPEEVSADVWDPRDFPAIVKPVHQHGSVAITHESVVRDLGQLRARVAHVLETVHEPALAEKFVVGRELTVSVWGNDRPQMLPLREIDFSRIDDPLQHILTWNSKWVDGCPEWDSMPVITHPAVSAVLLRRIEALVLRSYAALECRDYARIDLRVDADERPWIVDVNPNPDILPSGAFVGACAEAGYSYAAAMSAIVTMAVARLDSTNGVPVDVTILREHDRVDVGPEARLLDIGSRSELATALAKRGLV